MEFKYPETRFVRENCLAEQAVHVQSEAKEFFEAVISGRADHTTEEIVDVIHSAETALRIMLKEKLITPKGLEVIECQVIEKNRLRGYYE